MIPANKNRSYTEVPASLTNQLEQTFGSNSAPVGSAVKPRQTEEIRTEEKEAVQAAVKVEPKKAEEKSSAKKNDRNGQINICVPPETKIDWKVLFAKNNVNITQGIIFAVEHLKNEIENGEVILTVGGVISKK